MQVVEFGTVVDNGIIEIPAMYRKEYSSNVRVILLKDKEQSLKQQLTFFKLQIWIPL